MNRIVLAAAAASCVATGASALSLTGTIRDFSDSHPNFEAGIGGVQTGAVQTMLDADGKPVLSADFNNANFTNQADFSQWYRDIPGVNQSKLFSITLTDPDMDGVFTYQNSAFFPIDGELLGNEGRNHNYHFTYEISGQATFNLGDTFSFTGDDDLWVFVNDKLWIDIGGVHGSASDSGTVDAAFLANFGLTDGGVGSIDIFFAERHTTQSNFRIDTTLAVTTPVPVPAALPLLGGALAGLGFMARRRRRA